MFHVNHVRQFAEDNPTRLPMSSEEVVAYAQSVADDRGILSGSDLEPLLGVHIVTEIGHLIVTDTRYIDLSGEAIANMRQE